MWEEIPEPEPLDLNTSVSSYRLKVVGGWIVRTITSRYHGGTSVAQTFVQDTLHTWTLPVSE
jgi:hypothetical protein